MEELNFLFEECLLTVEPFLLKDQDPIRGFLPKKQDEDWSAFAEQQLSDRYLQGVPRNLEEKVKLS